MIDASTGFTHEHQGDGECRIGLLNMMASECVSLQAVSRVGSEEAFHASGEMD